LVWFDLESEEALDAGRPGAACACAVAETEILVVPSPLCAHCGDGFVGVDLELEKVVNAAVLVGLVPVQLQSRCLSGVLVMFIVLRQWA
jgi:hypothetical protein